MIGSMGRIAIAGAVGAIPAALALLGANAAKAGHRSGVSGRVVIDGMCPMPYTQCQGDGVPATITIRRARSGRLVRTVHTEAGDFRVRLRPGRYRLRAIADSGNGAGSARANVRRRHFTSVVIRLGGPMP